MFALRPIAASTLLAVVMGAPCAGRADALGLGLGPHRAQKKDAVRQIQDLEEQWRVAQLGDDSTTMERLLSEDYVGIGMNGMVNTKTQQIARIRNRAMVLTRIDLSDVKVKLVGPVAIVTSRADLLGTVDGNPINGVYRYTRVYQRMPTGNWKITNFEATRIRPNPRNGGGDSETPSGMTAPPAASAGAKSSPPLPQL